MTKPFKFLGYQTGLKSLKISSESQNRASEKIVQLYERGACKKRIEQYITGWHQWAQSGFSGCAIKIELPIWTTDLLDLLKSSA